MVCRSVGIGMRCSPLGSPPASVLGDGFGMAMGWDGGIGYIIWRRTELECCCCGCFSGDGALSVSRRLQTTPMSVVSAGVLDSQYPCGGSASSSQNISDSIAVVVT